MSINLNSVTIFHGLGKMSASYGGKKQKRSVDEVVTDEVLEKVRQIAVKNAEDGKVCSSTDEVMKIANECREQVGPDRNALLSAAQNQLNADVKSILEDRHRSILDYVLNIENKFSDKRGGVNGSYEANVGVDGHVYMKVYDENGENVGSYDSVTGFKPLPTKAEEECRALIWGEYSSTLKGRLNELKFESILSDAGHLDTSA